jgi:Holliday junction resolvasome RuvABC ATP-dependent DNA helicase subunit
MSRPPFEIEGFIGQRAMLTPVIREQEGAASRGEPMPHSLVLGPSGIGKTKLFGALARRVRTNLIKIIGNATMEEVCKALQQLKLNDFIVFDEGHNQATTNQELLYEVIDTGQIPARCQSSRSSCPGTRQ